MIKEKPSALSVDDQALMLGVVHRDHQAFAELYRLYASKLYSFAYHLLQNHHEAEEVLQDAFVKIWENAGKYDSRKSAPFAWFVMITRNLCIDRMRSHARRHLFLERWHSEDTSPDSVEGQRPVLAAELSQQISAALSKLPDEQWEAIKMAFYRGMTQEEISQKVRQPIGTIKSRIRRGMLKLRELLKDIYA